MSPEKFNFSVTKGNFIKTDLISHTFCISLPPISDTMTKKPINHSTSNVGRTGPWTKEHLAIIDKSIPNWHDFCLGLHKDLSGRDPMFTTWKRSEADRILSLKEFKTLPDGVSPLHFLIKDSELLPNGF
jgi:hypothetical protein